MPHDLFFDPDDESASDPAAGRAAMMFVGQPPWHGLGTRLDAPATAAQAIAAARLDWDVVKTPLLAFDGSVYHPLPGRFAVVRRDWLGRDDRPAFGVVGPDYTPLQNRDAFAFLDDLVGRGAAAYHTAGALGAAGGRVWILAKLAGDPLRVVKRRKIRRSRCTRVVAVPRTRNAKKRKTPRNAGLFEILRRVAKTSQLPNTPKGSRTPVLWLRTRYPRPLDDGGATCGRP